MATCSKKPTDYLQQSASIGVPGQWIDDETVDVRTSKIGGFASYFYLWHKSKEAVQCSSCKHKMYLLAQINAPLMNEECQRNVYLWMCPNAKCTKTSKGWKCFVYRGPNFSHLPFSKGGNSNKNNEDESGGMHDIERMIKQNNKQKKKLFESEVNVNQSFWNKNLNEIDDDDDEKYDEMGSKLKTKMDGLNDDFSRLMAMQSKLLNEVEKQQSKTRNKSKQKRKSQKQVIQKKSVVKKGSFVPFEIVFYNEGYYQNDSDDKVIRFKDEEIEIGDYMNEDKKEDDDDDNDEDSDDVEVDLLSDYMERIGVDKTQCVRYCYGDCPLVPHKVVALDKVPECEHCGKKKVFEFQVMSPVLNYLEPKQIHHDWLTVLVFVCPMSCAQSHKQHVVVCCE